jgi:aspartate/methionine/tyrosine aminotransferase
VRFPPFDHLHLYEDLPPPTLNISMSNVKALNLRAFREVLRKDLPLDWTDPYGSADLRRLVAMRHGVSPDRVLVTSGATEANFLVNAALVRAGDRVVVDSPIYSPLRDCPRGFGSAVTSVRRDCRDGWRLDHDAWRRAADRGTRLFVFANLNNPTSAALTKADLREIADLAAARNAHVLVDETFRETAFADSPPSAASFGPPFIALSTVTKLYGLGGLRVGWVVAEPRLLGRIRRIKDYTTVGGSVLGQIVAARALRDHRRLAARARRILDVNRRSLRDALARMPDLRGEVPDGGTVAFPHCRVSVRKLSDRLLRRYRTVIAPGRFFGMNDHFRLGLGGDAADLRRGLARLRRALADLR